MHTKHYHPELSKYLDYTPSVTDLAYARTVSSLEQDGSPGLKPAQRSDVRFSDVKRSPVRMYVIIINQLLIVISLTSTQAPPQTYE